MITTLLILEIINLLHRINSKTKSLRTFFYQNNSIPSNYDAYNTNIKYETFPIRFRVETKTFFWEFLSLFSIRVKCRYENAISIEQSDIR